MLASKRKKMCVGVCTIRHGYGAMRGTPLGRQLACGSSFDWRFSMIARADGSSGIVSPFGNPCEMSLIGPPPCHKPEKSGAGFVCADNDPEANTIATTSSFVRIDYA